MLNRMLKVKEVNIKEQDLHKLCKKAGISLGELAKQVGMNRSQLARYANGYIPMSFARWVQIKNVLDKII